MYTLFRHANISGQPIMRPLWFDFPEVPATYGVEDEFMLGPALLVSHDPLWQELLAAKYLSGNCVGYHACQHASVYSTYGAMRLVPLAMQVSPVLEQGATTRTVFLPGQGLWYDANTGIPVRADESGVLTMPVDMDTVPSFLRGGCILPLRVCSTNPHVACCPLLLTLSTGAHL